MRPSTLTLIASVLLVCPRLNADVLDIGTKKQLFIDEALIQNSHGVKLVTNSPEKRGQVLAGEMPWENGVLFGPATSILEDGGKFRMWYTATAAVRRMVNEGQSTLWTMNESGVSRLCYAESTDGRHWTKPNLGINEWEGSKANNIVLENVPNIAAGVFIDPKAPPEQRYKLLGTLHAKADVFPYGNAPDGHGMYVYTSPDGLHWTLYPHCLMPFSADTFNTGYYDAEKDRYLIYLRTHGAGGRRVGVIATDDVMKPWPYDKTVPVPDPATRRNSSPKSEIKDALGPDQDDPPDVDYYLPAAVKYPWADSIYFLFPSAYRHFPKPPVGRRINDGVLDSFIAVSRDGLSFRRPSRTPYLGLGLRGAKDCYRIYMCVGMLRLGDEILQYYGGFDYTHNASIGKYIEDQRQLIKGDKERLEGERTDQVDLAALRNRGGVFLASQRLDGFVSVDAGPEGGGFDTPQLRFRGSKLLLNLNGSATGEVKVELRNADGQPIEGYTFDDCDPLYENDTAKVVTWKKGNPDLTSLAGKPVSLGFRMRTAKLYAFQFID